MPRAHAAGWTHLAAPLARSHALRTVMQRLHPQHLRPPQLSCSNDDSGSTFVWLAPSRKAGHETVLQHLATTINTTFAQATGGPIAAHGSHGPGAALGPTALMPAQPASPMAPPRPGPAPSSDVPQPPGAPIAAAAASTVASTSADAAAARPDGAAVESDEDVARRLQAAELQASGRPLEDLATHMQQARARREDMPQKPGDEMPALGSDPSPTVGASSTAPVRRQPPCNMS